MPLTLPSSLQLCLEPLSRIHTVTFPYRTYYLIELEPVNFLHPSNMLPNL